MLSAEIIAIGSELLSPIKIDTNSLWITEKLNEIGIEVKLKTVVGDDRLRLEETIRDAVKRSDVIITTGGLGPTEDDITREVSAQAIGKELIYLDELEKELEQKFSRMGYKMPEINKRQAYIIKDSEILPNPKGSAAGMMIELNGKYFAILPGPPRENQPMFDSFVLPKLQEKTGEIIVKRKLLRVSGMGESAVDEAISPIYKKFEKIQTSILFNKSEIEIYLMAQSTSITAAEAMLEELTAEIKAKLGVALFSENGK